MYVNLGLSSLYIVRNWSSLYIRNCAYAHLILSGNSFVNFLVLAERVYQVFSFILIIKDYNLLKPFSYYIAAKITTKIAFWLLITAQPVRLFINSASILPQNYPTIFVVFFYFRYPILTVRITLQKKTFS